MTVVPFTVLVLAICHQEIVLLVAVAIMEPNASFPAGQDVLMHTVIEFLVLVRASVAGQGVSVTSVLITALYVITQDVQAVVLVTTDKPASLPAVWIVKMDVTNSMGNVMAAVTINMEISAAIFVLQHVLYVSRILHATCVMLDDGVTCAPQTVVLDVRMEDVAGMMAVAHAKMDGKEASVINV